MGGLPTPSATRAMLDGLAQRLVQQRKDRAQMDPRPVTAETVRKVLKGEK